MGLIFSASSDSHSYEHSSRLVEPLLRWLFPHWSEARVHNLHELFRKCAHLAEYAVLALLLWRAVRRPVKNDPRRWNWAEAGLALSIVFLYGASDEFHQIFVPNRTAQVSDVLIDTAGGAAGLLALWLAGRWRKYW
jgi:VanZ family protein